MVCPSCGQRRMGRGEGVEKEGGLTWKELYMLGRSRHTVGESMVPANAPVRGSCVMTKHVLWKKKIL